MQWQKTLDHPTTPPRCCWAKVWATPFCASSMAWKSVKPTCSHYSRLSQWTLAIGVLAAHDKQFNDTIILQVLSSAFFRASARRFLSARASLQRHGFLGSSKCYSNWKKYNPLRLAKDPQRWFANDSVMLVATSEPCQAAKNPLVIRGYYVYDSETGDEETY